MSELLSGISAYFANLTTAESIWLGIGFLGQGLFFSRWVVQWIASERKAESQIPVAFWYMSLVGSLIVLGVCHPSPRPGVHYRTGNRHPRLPAESDADPPKANGS